MIDRIKLFIDREKISVRAFEQSIGASDGLIRRAINNKTDIQSKWIAIIADKYPHINLNWLITGNGDMLNQNTAPNQSDPASTVLIGLLSESNKKIEELNREVGRLEAELRLVKEELAQGGGGGYQDAAGDVGCAAVG